MYLSFPWDGLRPNEGEAIVSEHPASLAARSLDVAPSSP